MSVLSLRRLTLLLLIIVPVFYFQCSSAGPDRGRYWHPDKKYWEPPEIIVAADRELTATPRVTVVYDVAPESVDGTPVQRPSKNRVRVTWMAKDGKFKLGLQLMNKKDCPIPEPECNGPRCSVLVPEFEDHAKAAPYRCTYELKNLSNVAQIDQDSDIVIVPCCM